LIYLSYLSNVYRACSFFTNLDLFCIDNARVIYRKIRYVEFVGNKTYLWLKLFSFHSQTRVKQNQKRAAHNISRFCKLNKQAEVTSNWSHNNRLTYHSHTTCI